MVERAEISRQEVEVFRVLQAHADTWLSNTDIAGYCEDVAARTVRAMTLKFVRLNLLDQAEVYPGHRYRLPVKFAKRNRGYVDRLRRTAEVFGLSLQEAK